MTTPIEKTINGVVVSANAFKTAIVDLIKRYPSGATLALIAKELGPEHSLPEGKIQLTRVLQKLRERGAIKYENRLYKVVAYNLTRGVTISHQYEIDTLTSLRAIGGVARFAELAWYMISDNPAPYRQRPRNRRRTAITDLIDAHMTPTAILERDTAYKGIREALQRLVEQGLVERRFALTFNTGPRMDGWYNLPPAELNSCILRPSALFHMMKAQMPLDHAFRPPGAYASHEVSPIMVHEGIDKHLQRVAEACQEARERRGLTIRQVMADPAVAASLKLWRVDCRIDLQRIRDDHEAKRRRDPSLPMLDNASAMELLYEHFEMFVSIDTGFHSRRPNMIAADCQFYTALGGLLQFDPVALSRGILVTCEPAPG